MKTSDAINELATALCAAQAIMKPAIKSKTNPHFKNRYADLDDIWEAARGPLTANGLSLIQTPSSLENGKIVITTRLCHKSGQWIEDSLSLKPGKDDAQGAGSCISYGRRYAMGIIGITSDEDDDGNAASKPASKLQSNIQASPASTAPTPPIFHRTNVGMLEWLEKALVMRKIDTSLRGTIAELMDGKPLTASELDKAIAEGTK